MEKNPYRHKARKAKRAGRHREKREEKKDWLRLTGRGGGREEEEVHYILYQKHIFKVNSQPKKKIIFECEFRLLLHHVAPIELNLFLACCFSFFLLLCYSYNWPGLVGGLLRPPPLHCHRSALRERNGEERRKRMTMESGRKLQS